MNRYISTSTNLYMGIKPFHFPRVIRGFLDYTAIFDAPITMSYSRFTIPLLFATLLMLAAPAIVVAQGPPAGGGGGRGGGGQGAYNADPLIVVGKAFNTESGQPLEYATVGIYSLRDSSLITGGITGSDGGFRLEVKQRKGWYLTLDFIGYTQKVISDFTVGPDDLRLDLGVIILGADAEQIQEVEVVAERSQMQMQLDKRVFTVGKDLSNTGGNAEDVLENIPSVEVDIDGNVSLRGSSGVRILIDGKPSGLTGPEALKFLQADQIERVEIVTNPSAKYDAEGEVGIINIILKKNRRQGLNGSVNANVGFPQNYGAGVNLNYRGKAYNLFAAYSLNYRERPGQGNYYQENYRADTTFSIFETEREHNLTSLGSTFRLGSDFFWKDLNTFTVSGLYRFGNGLNYVDLLYKDLDANGNLLQSTVRTEDEQEDQQTGEAEMAYERTFPKKDQKFSASAKWLIDYDTENADFEQYTDPANILEQRSVNIENETNIITQADYVHPLPKGLKFETGYRGTFRIIDNNYEVEELQNAEWTTLDGFFDNFRYVENIVAGYTILGQQIGKVTWQAGLRAEYTDITTESKVAASSNNRNYLNWFPSLHTSYKFNEKNTIQLSYSRRLSRPRFRDLLPFSNYSDARNFRVGNPNLNPEYTNSFELGYLKYWKTGSWLASVYYRYRTGVIERVNVNDDEGVTQSINVNLSEENNVGMEFSFNQEITKWWSANASVNMYYFTSQGNYQGQDLSAESLTGNLRVVSKWKIPKTFNLQASVMYNSPRRNSQGSQKSITSLDLGASRDILKNKGSISFTVRDVFNSRRWRSITDTEELYRVNEFQWANRQFMLSFSYRFGQSTKKQKRGDGDGGGGGDFDDF